MSYASFKQAILLLAASELLLNAQSVAQNRADGTAAAQNGEAQANTAVFAAAEAN